MCLSGQASTVGSIIFHGACSFGFFRTYIDLSHLYIVITVQVLKLKCRQYPAIHTNYSSAGSILDISKFDIDTSHGIAILQCIEYRSITRYLGDIPYDPEYRHCILRYLRTDTAAELKLKLQLTTK